MVSGTPSIKQSHMPNILTESLRTESCFYLEVKLRKLQARTHNPRRVVRFKMKYEMFTKRKAFFFLYHFPTFIYPDNYIVQRIIQNMAWHHQRKVGLFSISCMIFLRKDVRSFAASFITRINKKTQVLALFFLVKTISNENHTTRVQPSNNSGTKAYQNKHHV